MATQSVQFRPDYEPRLPGEYLRRILEERGIKIVDFARRTGRPTKAISEIISGKVAITPETAIQFERVLGEGAGFWLALEAKHQLSKARSREEEAESQTSAVSWAEKFPIDEMLKLRLLDKRPALADRVDRILRAFGVSSISAWEHHWQERLGLSRFKQQNHNQIDPFGVAVWLRCAEVAADRIETSTYSEVEFRSLLTEIRELTLSPWDTIAQELVSSCANVGVAVALVPSVAKTGLRGAAYWATKDKAVIAVSDRLKRESNVWFSFFHEACHILEHSKKAVFLDENGSGTGGRDIEKEADSFSAEKLVPRAIVDEFKASHGPRNVRITQKEFKRFANQHCVAPGLLLARLQHEEVVPQGTQLAKLKRKVEFATPLN